MFNSISYSTLILAAFLACGLVDSAPSENFRGGIQRIANGTSVTIGQTAFFVRLIGDFKYLCGGSLISANRVLTAAHCIKDKEIFIIYFGYITDKSSTGTQQRLAGSNDIIVHPEYKEKGLVNDLGIIKIKNAVQFTRFVAVVPIDRAFVNANTQLTIIGGGLNEERKRPNALQWANQVSMTNDDCAKAYNRTSILSTTLCTRGLYGNESTCNGDSGGPLILWENRKPFLVGVASFGGGQALGCYNGIPAGFTRISSHLDFIDKNIL